VGDGTQSFVFLKRIPTPLRLCAHRLAQKRVRWARQHELGCRVERARPHERECGAAGGCSPRPRAHVGQPLKLGGKSTLRVLDIGGSNRHNLCIRHPRVARKGVAHARCGVGGERTRRVLQQGEPVRAQGASKQERRGVIETRGDEELLFHVLSFTEGIYNSHPMDSNGSVNAFNGLLSGVFVTWNRSCSKFAPSAVVIAEEEIASEGIGLPFSDKAESFVTWSLENPLPSPALFTRSSTTVNALFKSRLLLDVSLSVTNTSVLEDVIRNPFERR